MPSNLPAGLLFVLKRAMARWFANRRAQQHQDLSSMSAQELKDLGIGRSEIPALLDQADAWKKDRR